MIAAALLALPTMAAADNCDMLRDSLRERLDLEMQSAAQRGLSLALMNSIRQQSAAPEASAGAAKVIEDGLQEAPKYALAEFDRMSAAADELCPTN